MSNFEYDLFIIGAGSGGVRAARTAASLGARVAIAENRHLGGTCVNVGCIPKKLFSYAANFSEEFKNSYSFGWEFDPPNFVWSKLIDNKNKEIKRLNYLYQKLLENLNVEILTGTATIVDKNTVSINTEIVTAKYILIASGSFPKIPVITGQEHIISSNEAFFLKQLPEKIIIVGGGYIAIEFSSIFKGLGVDTSLIHRNSILLRGFDKELCTQLTTEMQKKGIDIKLNSNVRSIKKQERKLIALLNDNEQLTATHILYATGRHPNTAHLGLSAVGVLINAQGAVMVNEMYQTNIDSIYAIGDVTNKVNLTPVALAEGEAVTKYLFNGDDITLDYKNIPTCVFSHPNLSAVGLTEENARNLYPSIKIYKSFFTPLKLCLSESSEKTVVKLIVNAANDQVIGAHMLGPNAGEIIQGISIAIKNGITKTDFDATIGIHPTIAEEFVSLRKPIS